VTSAPPCAASSEACRVGVRVRPCRCPRDLLVGGRRSVRASRANSDQYASLRRHDWPPPAESSCRKVPARASPWTPRPPRRPRDVVERIPLARKHTSAASISRFAHALGGRPRRSGARQRRLLSIAAATGWHDAFCRSQTVPCGRSLVDILYILFTRDRDGPTMADTLQQLLRTRAEVDSVAVRHGDQVWTWRDHIGRRECAGRGRRPPRRIRRSVARRRCSWAKHPGHAHRTRGRRNRGYVLVAHQHDAPG